MHAPQGHMATVEAPATTPVPHRTTSNTEVRVERARLNLSWLVQLHWWAILGQVVIVVGASSWTSIGVPILPLFAIFAAEVGGNVALHYWAQRAIPQVRTAGEQHDIDARHRRACEACPDITADGARPGDYDLHGILIAPGARTPAPRPRAESCRSRSAEWCR